MKHSFTLTQKEIKQAVLEYVENVGITVQDATTDDVMLIWSPDATEDKFSAVLKAGEV